MQITGSWQAGLLYPTCTHFTHREITHLPFDVISPWLLLASDPILLVFAREGGGALLFGMRAVFWENGAP